MILDLRVGKTLNFLCLRAQCEVSNNTSEYKNFSVITCHMLLRKKSTGKDHYCNKKKYFMIVENIVLNSIVLLAGS